MRIDFIFDSVCPWCYVGKRRLEQALALRPDVRAEIRWRPFLLNPDLPVAGIERRTYLERKFGSPHRIQRLLTAASAAGKSVGIDFNFAAITRTPNSIDAHRLILLADEAGRQAEIVEALFAAYFTQGLDIGDRRVLRDIADSRGLSGPMAEAYLAGGDGVAAANADNARVHRLGVSGVPCYIFADHYALAGAQEADLLARLIDIAREAELDAVTG